MENKNCKVCKNSYTIDDADIVFYKKLDVPPPALCPACRFKRRAVFRNERTLYKRTCALCNKSIITMYHPKSPYTVYCNDCWASDKWDPKSYAMDYDKNKTFFEQLKTLVQKIPKAATYSSAASGPNVNSEYANFAGGNKDGYLIFNCGPNNENCAYARGLMNAKDTLDSYFGDVLERVYEGINVQKSSGVAWVQNTTECLDSWFLMNCSGCSNCFGCVNLRHKQYQFFNEQLSPEDWKSRVKEVMGSYAKIEAAKKKFVEHALKFPRRENNNLKSVDCTGNYIFDSKNCKDSFEVSACEDSRYVFSVKRGKDLYDQVGHGRFSELLLEGVGVGAQSSRIIGSWWVEDSRDVLYSFATRNSAYCIGCSDIKNVKYAILNKEYSEEEYKKLREHIVAELKSMGEYGLFMPQALALFAYNETIGQDNMPMTRDEAFAMGFRWEDDIPRTKGKETLMPEQIPDHINDAPSTIVNEILCCITCGYNYRLTQAELAMYKRALIPIPRQCFGCRHEDRLRHRGPMTLYDRACAKCGKNIKTNYSPERPEIVYCEQCYQSEVI